MSGPRAEMNGRGDLGRIFSITEKVVVFEGLDDVLTHLAKTSLELTMADAVTIRVFDRPLGMLRIVKALGLSPAFLTQRALKLGEGITGRVVLEGEPFLSDDVAAVPHCATPDLVREEGLRALMSVPLKSKGGSTGCISVYRKSAEPFTQQNLLLLSMFAAQTVEALERMRQMEDLQKQATFDMLTGVLNKTALLKEVEAGVNLALRHGHSLGIVFLDLDNFKGFNDTHGHLLGDKLLADFASVVAGQCRKTDVLGRFGGEEFLLMAPHTDKHQVRVLAEKLIKAVGVHPFMGSRGNTHITFSAGVAGVPEDGRGVEEILYKADAALYHSKKNGKNRVTLWCDDLRL